MSDVIDRLADANRPNSQHPPATGGSATVTNAATGTFPDGRKKITVSWQGVSIDCAYLASYTPATSDVVAFLKVGASYLVLGKPAR